MFKLNKCKCPDCKRLPLSVIDQDLNLHENEDGWCYEHHPELETAVSRIHQYIMKNDKIVGLNACGIKLENIDISGKKMYGCNFQRCTFCNLNSKNLRVRMSIMDNSTFTDSTFINSNIQFSSGAGSKFVHVLFTGSDLIHNNFNGTTFYQCSLDNSDLYNTRFIKAILINTSLKDCNLKKTVFYESVRECVSFKLSNTREALILRDRGGMMGDTDVQFSDDEKEEITL